MSEAINSGWMIQLAPEPLFQLYQVWPQTLTLIFTNGLTTAFCCVPLSAAEAVSHIKDGQALLDYMTAHFPLCPNSVAGNTWRIQLQSGIGNLLLQSGGYLLLEDAP